SSLKRAHFASHQVANSRLDRLKLHSKGDLHSPQAGKPALFHSGRAPEMPRASHRRDFLKSTAALGAGVWLGTNRIQAIASTPNEKLNLALIGIGGQGRKNLDELAPLANIAALCDLDEERAGDAFAKFPKAVKFQDYRKMLDAIHAQIDG